MAHLDKKTIEYIADLARIGVDEKDEEELLRDLAKILHYVEQLNELDTSSVPARSYVTEVVSKTPLREDMAVNTYPQAEFLKGAPQHSAGMVKVPPVLKGE